jgi:hypothetical protein
MPCYRCSMFNSMSKTYCGGYPMICMTDAACQEIVTDHQ